MSIEAMIIGHKFTLYERDYIRIYEIQNSFLMKKGWFIYSKWLSWKFNHCLRMA